MNDTDKLLNHLPELTPHQESVRLMYFGDLLGPGASFWIGPGVAPDVPGESQRVKRLKRQAAGEMQSALVKSHVPGENMVLGAIERIGHHVGGEEPTWLVNAPTDAERRLAESILLAAWEGGHIFEVLSDFRDRLVRDGRAGLRHRVPAGALDNYRVRTRDPVAAARLQRVEACDSEDIAGWEDDDTLTARSVCRVPQDDQDPIIEYALIDQGQTVLMNKGRQQDTEVYRLGLGGLTPHIVASAPQPVGPGMLRLQMALSMGMTMLVKNTELAGFVERWLHNVSPQMDKDGNPIPIVVGPGMTVVTKDAVVRDEDGNEKAAGKASYERLPPVSADPLETTIRRSREEFYAAAHQQHYLMGSDATASGESRKTAMAGFAASLRPMQRAYRLALQELLTLWLRMSCALAGRPGLLDAVTIDVRLTDRVTEPTAQDRQQSLSEWEKGAISHELFLSDRGVLDPAAEKRQIAAEAENAAAIQPDTGGVDGQQQQ